MLYTVINEVEREQEIEIQSIDYVEFYVGNAKQSSFFLKEGFGFHAIAYSGLESGVRDRASYVLRQNNIHLVVTASLDQHNEISSFVKKHGDGVKDIALRVSDVEKTYHQAVKSGAIPILPPMEMKDEYGVIRKAVIGTYGDTIHSFIERKDYHGIFLPTYTKLSEECRAGYFTDIDHIVGNVEMMDEWTAYYEDVLGFKQLQQFSDDVITTEYSALMSKVMCHGGSIKFPINEPASGRRKSQIQEYLDYNNGPGVQHIALQTNNIIAAVAQLKQKGVEFINTPANYYANLEKRVGCILEDRDKLQELGILVDRDEDGYMLQIFTKPWGDRPTIFFEIIERKGSSGFGKGNFKALFEAIEREQSLRGNI